MRVLREILKELVQIRELLQNLPKEIPASAVAYLGSNQAKRPLQEFFTWNHRWVAMLHESDFGDALFHLDQFVALGEFKKEIEPSGHYVAGLWGLQRFFNKIVSSAFPGPRDSWFRLFRGIAK